MKFRSSTLRFVRKSLLCIGIALLAYAGGTLAYANVYQRYQLWKFEGEMAAPPAIHAIPALEAAPLREGDLLGKLEIPRLGIKVMVLQGTDDATLALGAGHVRGTPLPGGDGNAAIAAHRDTSFRKLEGIRRGDTIQYGTLHHGYAYVVESIEIVDPSDTRVIESSDRQELTLISCFPFHFVGSAPKRFIVHALPLK